MVDHKLVAKRQMSVGPLSRSAVTSLEWHKEDSTVFASSGADDQVITHDFFTFFIYLNNLLNV